MTESQQRAEVAAFKERPSADVLVVGGGINGIAVCRELALQGVDVALVERGDFVSGTSSASSHMVHGGIRYLENGEFRLVKEGVTERNRLLRNAPHLVRPLETTIPIYRTFSGVLAAPFRLLISHGRGASKERGALLIKIGLMLYDTFSRDGGQVPRHKFWGRRKSLAEFPDMNPELRYTASYYDASMPSPERLALDVLHDGLEAGSARAANYLSAVGLSDGRVRLRDETTGEEFGFEARVVVNASGPWTDRTNAALGQETRFMGGTKGSHIVLDHPELFAATRGREIFFEHSDGRIVMIYPIGDRVMVGTTDIPARPTDEPVCTDEEIDYFFDLIAHVFPRIPVDRSQIVYALSGVRPMPRAGDLAPGLISRDYRIEEARREGVAVLSLVGGKWTTFRAVAEHLSDETLKLLGVRRTVGTGELPIGGGKGYPAGAAARARWIAEHGRASAIAEKLLDRYGTRASEVLADLPADAEEMAEIPGYFAEELAHLAAHEQVVHLEDLLLRRTVIAFQGGATREALVAAAAAIAPALGWDEARQSDEVDRAARILRDNHLVPIDA